MLEKKAEKSLKEPKITAEPVKLERPISTSATYEHDLRQRLNTAQGESYLPTKMFEGVVYAQDKSEKLRLKIDN